MVGFANRAPLPQRFDIYFGASIGLHGGWRWIGQPYPWSGGGPGALAADLYVAGNANWITALALAYGSIAAWGTLSLVVGLTDLTFLHCHVMLGLILPTTCFMVVLSLAIRSSTFPRLGWLAYMSPFS